MRGERRGRRGGVGVMGRKSEGGNCERIRSTDRLTKGRAPVGPGCPWPASARWGPRVGGSGLWSAIGFVPCFACELRCDLSWIFFIFFERELSWLVWLVAIRPEGKGLKGRFWGHGVWPRGVNVGEKTWGSSSFPRVLSFLSFGHA